MIFLQGAARRDSPAGACLDLAEQGLIELCVSSEILAEVEDVLRRPRIRAKFPALTDDVVTAFAESILTFATLFDGVKREFALERDPKDEIYLNLACHAGAAYLVSRDNDLLHLTDSSDNVGQALRERYPHLRLVEPIVFLRTVRDDRPVRSSSASL